jgi:elongation factor Ts
MVEGKLNAFFAETPGGCLLDQHYIRDDSKTVARLLDEASAELKEPVRVRRFSFFQLGID